MTLVGIDIGATKTHLAVAEPGRGRTDQVHPTDGWRVRRPDEDAPALVALLRRATGGVEPDVTVVGAHGCDSAAACLALQERLAGQLAGAVLVVNDAELLVPAAAVGHGIGVVAGTGSIAVTRLADRTMLVAGGWGWLLGDEGGAVGLVREALRAVRGALDSGEARDPLIEAMLAALGVADPILFGRRLLEIGTAAAIGAHVEAVFQAAAAGSALASGVIRDGGRALALLVSRLVRRGAFGGQVVASGGVITRQPGLMAAFRDALAADWRVTLLAEPPVQGALRLAESIRAGTPPVGLAPARRAPARPAP